VRDVASVTDERLLPVELDVTDPAQVAAAAQRLGDVQIVVNNAGIGGGSTPLSSDLDHARAELEVNYLGLVSMTQAFAPVLAANGGGAFVNVLSLVSWVAMPSLTTYSASKAAAWSYTNAARVELARSDTQVVGVHVGFVDTELTAALPVEKIAPQAVATSALDALEEGRPEAVVDEFSAGIKAALHDDQSLIYPAIAGQFNRPASQPSSARPQGRGRPQASRTNVSCLPRGPGPAIALTWARRRWPPATRRCSP
jgi:NAD(P)-dependent dehydrogenase (short-subunit alcohol dehydrogenase family)